MESTTSLLPNGVRWTWAAIFVYITTAHGRHVIVTRDRHRWWRHAHAPLTYILVAYYGGGHHVVNGWIDDGERERRVLPFAIGPRSAGVSGSHAAGGSIVAAPAGDPRGHGHRHGVHVRPHADRHVSE
jgi:hypothetical protein